MAQMIFKNRKSHLATNRSGPSIPNMIRILFLSSCKNLYHAAEVDCLSPQRLWCVYLKAIADVYPQLNKSLLCRIMLHDLAKVIRVDRSDQTEYTVRGNLISHIALIDSEIAKAVVELGIDDTREEVVLLRHVFSATMDYSVW